MKKQLFMKKVSEQKAVKCKILEDEEAVEDAILEEVDDTCTE